MSDIRTIIFVLSMGAILAACSEQSPQAEQNELEASDTPRVALAQTRARLPEWAIPIEGEFWRADPDSDPRARLERAFAQRDHAISTSSRSFETQLDAHDVVMRNAAGQRSFEVRASTEQISCEGRSLATEPKWLGVVDTLQRRHGHVVEHVHADRSGLRFSWVLNERDCSAFEVRWRLDQVREIAPERGQVETASGARLALSQAILVDSTGRRWPVPMRLADANTLHMRVDESILDEARFPVALDPVLSPEIAVSPPGFGDNQKAARDFDVASSSSGSLIVWDVEVIRHRGILAARLDASGSLLDLQPIVLPAGRGSYVPGVASNGVDYLVAWRSRNSNSQLAATRIRASDGAVLDPSPMRWTNIPGRAGSTDAVQVAYAAGKYIVLWRGFSDVATGGLSFSRIEESGQVLDPGGILLADDSTSPHDASIASNGSGFLAAWIRRNAQSQDEVVAARLDANGQILDRTPVLIGSGPDARDTADVASDGTDYLVSWTNSSGDVRATRLFASSGSVENPEGLVVAPNAGWKRRPDAVWTGTEYWMVYDTGGFSPDVHRVRLRADATMMPNDSPLFIAAGQDAGVTISGNQHTVVWKDGDQDAREVRATRVAADDTIMDTPAMQISSYPDDQHVGGLAATDTTYLAVWVEMPTQRVMGRRFDTSGAALDPEPFVFAVGTNGFRNVQATTNGTDFFVVWVDAGELVGANVRASDGYVGTPYSVSGDQTFCRGFELATDGEDYIVVWSYEDSLFAPLERGVFGRIVDSSTGLPTGTGPFVISDVRRRQDNPTVASNGSFYVVAWQDGREDYSDKDIFAARVDSSGSVLDPDGFKVADGTIRAASPTLASDGSGFLVVWRDSRTEAIMANRIDSRGVLLDRTPFEVASGQYTRLPDVIHDGTNYLVQWQDPPRDSSELPQIDFRARRVTSSGDILDGPADTPGFELATTLRYSAPEAPIACHEPQRCMVSYMNLNPDKGHSLEVYLKQLWTDDEDSDGFRDGDDNCPTLANPAQEDTDGDAVGDACDSCPSLANPSQGTVEVCKIDGECFAAGEANPENPCEACEPTTAGEAWSPDDAATCDDGLRCTSNDRCSGGSCIGDRPDCSHLDETCVEGVCEEATVTCVARPLDEGTTCGAGPSCNAGTFNPGDMCDGSGACIVGEPRSCSPYLSCADSTRCSSSCDVDGECAPDKICELGVCVTPPADSDDGGGGVTVDERGANDESSGGGCSSTAPSPTSWPALLLFGLVVFRRHRVRISLMR